MTAMCVTILMVLVAVGDNPASAPSHANDGQAAIQLFEKTLRGLEGLSFELEAFEGGIKPTGELLKPRSMVRASVQMARDKVRLEAYDAAGTVNLIYCDDGRILHQWSPTKYQSAASPPVDQGRNVEVEDGSRGCFVGSCLRSWLTIDGERSFVAARLRTLSEAQYLGTQVIDGDECGTFVDGALTVDTDERLIYEFVQVLSISQRTGLLRRWTGTQCTRKADGTLLQEIVHDRHYRKIRTDPVLPEVFEFKRPAVSTDGPTDRIGQDAVR